MSKETLFPPIDPRESGLLTVSEIHKIYWERSGNPAGEKILIIHGGPGGGVSLDIEDILILKSLISYNLIREVVANQFHFLN